MALHDGRVGGDLVRSGVGGEGEAHLDREGPAGVDGEAREAVVEGADEFGLVGRGEADGVRARAGAVVEVESGLGRLQGALLVDEDDDRVDRGAAAGGGVGEVEVPGAVAAAGLVGVGAVVDAGGEGKLRAPGAAQLGVVSAAWAGGAVMRSGAAAARQRDRGVRSGMRGLRGSRIST
ncbi:hypothetical protein ACQ86D_18375 [Streptomyces galilaeus]